MSPTVIAQLNDSLLTQAGNGNVAPLTQQQFKDTFNDTLSKFSIDGFSYQDSTSSTQQHFQKEAQGNYTVHQSMLNSLVNALNKNGAGVALPTDKVYSAADFANTYNALQLYWRRILQRVQRLVYLHYQFQETLWVQTSLQAFPLL